LRRRETLRALTALSERNILKKREYKLLTDGYLFLRTLDHRLRLEQDRSIDAFEREPGRLEHIAHALGYNDLKPDHRKRTSKAGQKLLRDYESRREKIRRCYESYFLLERQSESQRSAPASVTR
jgi:glutamate-ammonia-ligase adenylyltransferase